MAADYVIDPSVTDFSSYSHILGNNEFDADMDIVESFVRARQQHDNILAQSAVFNYYISRLLHYWNFTKEYVMTPEFIEDLSKDIIIDDERRRKLKHIQNNIELYEKNLLNRIKKITESFQKKSYIYIHISNITSAFYFVSMILCGDEPDFGYVSPSNHYPLPNSIGLFGLNTYLYALFEDIYLVGVPIRSVYYDRHWGCPAKFMEHDKRHNNDTYYDIHIHSFSLSKYFYYTILNDPELTMLQKECHITNIWVEMHEVSPLLINVKDEDMKNLPQIFYKNYERFYESTGDDFKELYKSFKEFTLSDDNIKSYEAATSVPLRSDFQEMIKDKSNTEFELYYTLACWYTCRYFLKVTKERR